jgi:nitroreductase
MDVWDVIKNRRSIRSFDSARVNDEILKKLVLEAGIWAPSGNSQAWRFIIVNDSKILNKVKAVSPGLLGDPSALIVVCHDLDYALKVGGEMGVSKASFIDTGVAAENIMLAAYALGLGTCPIASFNPEAIQTILGLPEKIFPQLLIAVGIPSNIPNAPRRNYNVFWFNLYGKD